ncbi:hypothetical protein YC2023_012528 [Brassica napus]
MIRGGHGLDIRVHCLKLEQKQERRTKRPKREKRHIHVYIDGGLGTSSSKSPPEAAAKE